MAATVAPVQLPQNVQGLESFIKGPLSTHFQVPVRQTIRTGYRPKNSLDQDLLDEWKQHLMDLGYLDERFASLDTYTTVIIQAIKAFCKDDTAISTVSEDGPLPQGFKDNMEHRFGRPGDLALNRLNRYTSFDGEPLGAPLPGVGSLNLYSRILHFRLKTLGLYNQSVAAPVNSETEIALSLVSVLLGTRDGENLIDLLGNVKAMTERYRELNAMRPLVIRDTPTPARAVFGRLAILNGKFIHTDHQWRVLERSTPDVFQQLRRDIATRPNASMFTADYRNRFGLGLLQLWLWMNGYYQGHVDQWWGPLSTEALDEALAFERVPKANVSISLGNGLCALNFPALEEDVLDKMAGAQEVLEKNEAAIIHESSFLQSKEKENQTIFDKIWAQIRAGFKKIIQVGRRIYHGAGTLIKSALRGLLNGLDWIKSRAEKIAAPVVNFFRQVYKRIREGIRMAARSLNIFAHFVFGKPVITQDGHSFVLSRFDFDRDGVLFASNKAPPKLIQAHQRLLARLSASLSLLLSIAGQIIFLVRSIAGGPVSWLQIGFRIGTIVRKVFQEHLQPATA